MESEAQMSLNFVGPRAALRTFPRRLLLELLMPPACNLIADKHN